MLVPIPVNSLKQIKNKYLQLYFNIHTVSTIILIIKLSLLVIVALFIISISPAYAQHHSGSLAPPIDFDGMSVALNSILSPEDFTFEDTKSANLSIRFFDSQTDTNITSVTYRIQIFQGDDLLANEYFYDEDGILDLEVRPTIGCKNQELWKCTNYFGEKHPIAGGYFARGDSRPIIEGPVFDKSGQYNVKVSIVGATNPKTMTTSDLHFETFLIIPEKQNFLIQTANAEAFPISIKSFDSEISNFAFDEEFNKISYETSFDWNHSKEHGSNSKQIIQVQKDFPVFKQGHDIDVFIEGIKIERPFLFDVSSPNENIIRIDIPHEEIISIHDKLEGIHINQNTMKVDVLSGSQTQLNELNFSFENGYTTNVTWNSQLESGQEIPFTFSFLDTNNNPIDDILFAYSITDSNGNEVWTNMGKSPTFLGIVVQNGIHQESAMISNDGNYQFTIILTGQENTNFEKFFTSKSDFEIVSSHNLETAKEVTFNQVEIPSWIKNSAGWWAEDIVGDDEFIQSIQFLIKEKIISIPASQENTSNSQEIPDWVKNNAGWWSADLISDRDFMKGIEFLGEQGIIKVS